MRRIIDLSNFDNGFSVLPTGQSGLFGSAHYKTKQGFKRRQLQAVSFSVEAIKKESKNKLSFVPNKPYPLTKTTLPRTFLSAIALIELTASSIGTALDIRGFIFPAARAVQSL